MIAWRGAGLATLLLLANSVWALPAASSRPDKASAHAQIARRDLLDDSLPRPAAKDLALRPQGEHAAEALARFVEGTGFEEEGETEKALEAYRKVLDLDPGQVTLAVRVASMLSHDDQNPEAIDVLKDAVKARPNAPEPYLQLAFIYARYLQKHEQALEYANKAISLSPRAIDGYERLCEIELGGGDPKKAIAALERAAKVETNDPQFWIKLGRLYAALLLKPETPPSASEVSRLNEVFQRASTNGQNDAGVLKEVGDYFAATQQIPSALPLYLRVLELQPDDAKVREKLATAFVLTNQRTRAIETLEQIIKDHPEKYQPYELLGQLHDDQARSLARAHDSKKAETEFRKAAENYEQSLLINSNRPTTYLRLAELLLGSLGQQDRAVTLLSEARRRFPDTPEFAYYLGLALREAKRPKEAVIAFEESLNEAQNADAEFLKPRFYVDYGAAAEQAGLYDKAAELFRKAIALDPPNAAEPYNDLGYMWAEQNLHLDEAEDAVKHALQLDPTNGAYLDSLGWVQYRQGKYDQALETLQRAIRNLSREDAVLFDHLGETYAKLQRLPEAMQAWQKAKSLDPTNAELTAKIEQHQTQVSRGAPATVKP
ncbi:MAG: tetratricopeptide repeat protein [Verrucomicrobiota bacterium]